MSLFVYKNDFMRAVLKAVSRDKYYLYFCDYIDSKRYLKFYHQCVDRYHIDMNKNARYRAKQKGLAVSQLFSYIDDTKQKIYFCLLVTEPSNEESRKEQSIFNVPLSDTRKKSTRLCLFDEYTLIKTPRIGKPPTYTFQLSDDRLSKWRMDIKHAVRQKDEMKQRQLHYNLLRVPKFNGVRKQAYKLLSLLDAERTRTYKIKHETQNFLCWVGKFKKPTLYPFDQLDHLWKKTKRKQYYYS
ncbi:hypothetical protein CF386_12620 (plasmid) [Paraphotobacterium marinum]|uniref:Uncharacterized protein n=1 Tax=Paraphotobacterium marinum TaxID=1755811 RepID=A0A220VIX3_9GAMM|nr:hypothetical protein [Paraphotobacterium marinum]ASK79893.1 hypothetical protein CF386_12620 [Paraphotobacterium marinum]